MNELQFEKSPYLLQHKDNPVDWMAWGARAFEKAKAEDKPIFRAPRGGLLGARCVKKDIDQLCKAAGIERFAAHAFREDHQFEQPPFRLVGETVQRDAGIADLKIRIEKSLSVERSSSPTFTTSDSSTFPVRVTRRSVSAPSFLSEISPAIFSFSS